MATELAAVACLNFFLLFKLACDEFMHKIIFGSNFI